MLAPWKKSYDKPRQRIKNQRCYFADRLYPPSSQSFGFSRSHVWMSELDHKEGWALKNWCFWTMALGQHTRRSNQSILKEINSEYSLEGLMLRLKLQYFGQLMRRANSLKKDPDAGKDWRQEEKGMTENEMVGWHHWLKGHEFEQAPGDGDGQGSLACCSPTGSQRVRHDWATKLNWYQ